MATPARPSVPPYVYVPTQDERDRIAKMLTLLKMFDLPIHVYVREKPQYWPEPIWLMLDERMRYAFDTLEQLERAVENILKEHHDSENDGP